MHRRVLPPIVLLGTLLAGGCSDSSGPSEPPLGYYVLTGTPDPTTVFNTIAETYRFYNNLTNSIWQRQANVIVSGEFMTDGYWAFAPMTDNYVSAPDQGTDIHARMVQVPATNTVIYSRSASANGVGLGTVANIAVATIDTTTGLLSAGATAVFGDGFAGSCQLASSSATEYLCYDGSAIRRYLTSTGSATLTANGVVTLSDPLPSVAACVPNGACYGSTFAFDGAFYYFAANEGSSVSLDYIVYDATGTLVNTYTATGSGAINGTYFDWSVGRYSTHDGFGNRQGASVYASTGTTSDSHNFGPIASTHTLQ